VQVPLRLVLDTNVVVAGLLWSGPPRRLLEEAIEDELQLFSSDVLLSELVQTLGYKKFGGRIASFGVNLDTLVAQYSALVSLVAPMSVPRVVADDADDAASASLILTGDRKHLLPIGRHAGIAIVTAREALEHLVPTGRT
jgi:putative PIN family toxin of toxin-antitoxin system